jgi:hypothetical protein
MDAEQHRDLRGGGVLDVPYEVGAHRGPRWLGAAHVLDKRAVGAHPLADRAEVRLLVVSVVGVDALDGGEPLEK